RGLLRAVVLLHLAKIGLRAGDGGGGIFEAALRIGHGGVGGGHLRAIILARLIVVGLRAGQGGLLLLNLGGDANVGRALRDLRLSVCLIPSTRLARMRHAIKTPRIATGINIYNQRFMSSLSGAALFGRQAPPVNFLDSTALRCVPRGWTFAGTSEAIKQS